MAKKNMLDTVDKAMEGAALKEETAKKVKEGSAKVTQKEGNHPLLLTKLSEEHFQIIQNNYPGVSVASVILLALREKLSKDGLI